MQKPSTPSSKPPLFTLITFLVIICLSPTIGFIEPKLIHPNLRHHVHEFGYVALVISVLLASTHAIIHISFISMSIFFIGVSSLVSNPITKAHLLIQFILCFLLIYLWNKLNFKPFILTTIFVLDISLNFNLKVFESSTWPVFTGLNWSPELTYQHYLNLLILPCSLTYLYIKQLKQR